MTDDCWILTDGRASMKNQCLGLTEALGMDAVEKTVHLKSPWKFLPPGLWLWPFAALGPGSDTLTPPWPRLLVAAGQKTAALSAAIRKASGGKTFTVQVESPGMSPRNFGLVVPPRHDRLSGRTVFSTPCAMHRVTPARLKQAAEDFAPQLKHLPRPLVAVLVGGSNRAYQFTNAVADTLCDGLEKMAAAGCGFVVTMSRRTGPEAEKRIRARMKKLPALVWDGSGDNPYYGYLALADHIVVTCDSVLMASEAVATGKPVHVLQLEGEGGKFARFHRALAEDGITRPFTGSIEHWHYAPVNAAATVADLVRRELESGGYTGG